MIDRLEAMVRHLLRLQPKPRTTPRITPFIREVRQVREEALKRERSRRVNPLSNAAWPERPRD